jgi:hypothetical protein
MAAKNFFLPGWPALSLALLKIYPPQAAKGGKYLRSRGIMAGFVRVMGKYIIVKQIDVLTF